MKGMPSPSSVKAMTFLMRDMSLVRDGKRALSWFSEKMPSRVGSLQEEFTVRSISAKRSISPEELRKASLRGKKRG